MPILPAAHARSMLRGGGHGGTVFHPGGADHGGFLVPQTVAEARLLRRLRRIRFVQLSAWALLAAVFIAALVVVDEFGMRPPGWLFVLAPVGALVAIELLARVARYRLARGLTPAPGPAPSWLRRIPTWAMFLVALVLVGSAFGLAVYIERAWPLKAVIWLHDIGDAPAGWKIFAKVAKAAAVVGGATAALFGGTAVVRRWLRPSRDGADSSPPS